MKGHHYELVKGCAVCKGEKPENELDDWEKDVIQRIQSGEWPGQ